ncbi:hypothetical protein L1I30_05025 [Gillisia sp. M10.2A]|uniref:Uncharacterized protein n=1 Tax=Gillisia lutea TaxID=2909668 RepID=A0ABS9EDT2_9FLAO|nr:hypothetical protein [Gillisia lutea]MCF4101018.1 hypothetical protein [Gillisia lutea]
MQKDNFKAILCKIILFYSVFYVVMKLIAILFDGAWPIPNLILVLPFIAFAVVGGLMFKRDYFTWTYAILGIIIISVIRYYEAEWVLQLHQYFG